MIRPAIIFAALTLAAPVGIVIHAQQEIAKVERAANAPPKACADEYWSTSLSNGTGHSASRLCL